MYTNDTVSKFFCRGVQYMVYIAFDYIYICQIVGAVLWIPRSALDDFRPT